MYTSTGSTLVDSAGRRVGALAEEAAAAAAGADGHHDARIRSGLVGAPKSNLHVAGHRPGDQQHVGVSWARDQVDPEALEIVQGIGRRDDLHLARIAASRIDLPHVERPAEPTPNPIAQTRRGFGQAEPWPELDRAERAAAGHGIDVERRRLRELLSGVGGNLGIRRETRSPVPRTP